MKVFKWFLRMSVLVLLFVAVMNGGKIRLVADIAAAMIASMAIGIYVGEWSKNRKKLLLKNKKK